MLHARTCDSLKGKHVLADHGQLDGSQRDGKLVLQILLLLRKVVRHAMQLFYLCHVVDA